VDRCAELTERVLGAHETLYRCLLAGQVSVWLNIDLTMVQLKTLLIVVDSHGATGGQLARGLGVGLSTVTGVVDRLVAQGLVTRREDPGDRRITRVEATPAGVGLAQRLYFYRRERMRRMLQCLDADQLDVVERAIALLVAAAGKVSDELVREDAGDQDLIPLAPRGARPPQAVSP
jgi:DNA-binding MarR family transcriptional regulator